jgi:tetratricopeptide (TPR) repeat protein
MSRRRTIAVGLACFLLGMVAHSGLAQSKGAPPTARTCSGSGRGPATALLDNALNSPARKLERIAVGARGTRRNKARGQKIFDEVTGDRKVKGSDWFRVGRVYEEAGEWDKAQGALDKALAAEKDDDTGMLEYGGLAILHKDRAKAEGLFEQAFKKNPKEFWHWVNAGGS